METRLYEASIKDSRKLASAGLKNKAEEILKIIESDPYTSNPPFEKLLGDLKGAYSRRINIHNRIVYQIIKGSQTVKILRMWTHYE